MTDCPGEDALRQLLAHGEMDRALEEHLSNCPACQTQFDAWLSSLTESKLLRKRDSGQRSVALEKAMKSLVSERPALAPAWSPGEPSFSFLAPPDRPDHLGRLAHYTISRVLGRGGMGIVFLAEDTSLKRQVAIKALAPLSVLSPEARSRFLREAQTAAAIDHENIVGIYAIEHAGEVPCLVLQYVQGESLAERLARTGKLEFSELVDLGRDLARGLTAAHSARLIHRDIKPANILLDERAGRALIADFGLAKPLDEAALTQSGLIAGTPEFIAPEQVDSGIVDERADLFSLGATLYLAATGVSPFRAATPWAAIERVRRHQPVAANTLNPAVPLWLSELIAQLLAKDPPARPQSAAEVFQQFEAAAPATVVDQRQADTVRGLERRRSLSRLAVVATSLCLLAVVGLAAWQGQRRSPRDERSAEAAPHAEGFYIAGQSRPWGRLAEAIANAPDGGTIEIRGDGPFRCEPLSAGDKRLTIRAATGAHPMLIMDSPGQPSERPLLETNADLSLAGLDIRWTITAEGGRSEAELLGRSVIAATRGTLQLAHCRIVCGRMNACAGSAGNLRIEACHLVSENGVGVYWGPTSEAACDIAGSAIDAWLAMAITTSAEIANPHPAKLTLASDTFRGARGLQFMMGPRQRQPIEVRATSNLFALEALTVMVPQRRAARPDATLTTAQAIAQLRTCLSAWTGQENVYRRGLEFVAYAPGPRPKPLPAGVDTLAGWGQIWGESQEPLIEGSPKFAEPLTRGAFSLPKLERIDEPSDSIPQAGAAADQLGPD